VDGGATDNAPILAALEQGCNEIYVVHTNSLGLANGINITDQNGLARFLARTRRLRSLATIPASKLVAEYEQKFGHWIRWGLLPRDKSYGPLDSELPVTRDARVLHIVPSRPLGSLVRSLIFRSEQRTRWLIQLGHDDAGRVLARFEGNDQPER